MDENSLPAPGSRRELRARREAEAAGRAWQSPAQPSPDAAPVATAAPPAPSSPDAPHYGPPRQVAPPEPITAAEPPRSPYAPPREQSRQQGPLTAQSPAQAAVPTQYAPPPPYPPQSVYPPVDYYSDVATSRTNTLAIWGFVGAFFLWPAGLILSIKGLRRAPALGTGKGLAIAGIVISCINGILGLLIAASTIVGTLAAMSETAGGTSTVSSSDAGYYPGAELSNDVTRTLQAQGYVVESMSCEDTPQVAVGVITDCQGFLDGEATGIRVTFDDDQGHFTLDEQVLPDPFVPEQTTTVSV